MLLTIILAGLIFGLILALIIVANLIKRPSKVMHEVINLRFSPVALGKPVRK